MLNSFTIGKINCLCFSVLFAFIFCASPFGAYGQDDFHEIAFTNIYTRGDWGRDEQGNGSSGSGSTIQEVLPYVEMLSDFMSRNNIKSVVDVGCGDWQFSHLINWGGIDYKGYDIVKSVVDANNIKYGNEHVKFFHGNCSNVDLPEADLLICKDVLQHISNKAIKKIAEIFSRYRYCLITNDYDPESSLENSQVKGVISHSRPLDLTKEPFNINGVNYFDYQSGNNHKQVLLIVNPR